MNRSIYIKLSALLLAGILCITACTKNFDKVNTDPTAAKNVPPGILLTKGLLFVSGGEYEAWRANLIYCGPMIQHFASLNLTYVGDKYLYNDDYSGAAFNSFYPNAIKILTDIISQTDTVPALSNFAGIARICRVVVLQRITDLYGDVPYTQMGLGYLNQNFYPGYDQQSVIYTGLAAELAKAAGQLDDAKANPGTADISSYGGTPSQWKKLAYSLMLRVGMRLTKKTDQTQAKAIVQQAISGGVMTAREDVFYIHHAEGDYDNPNSHVIGTYQNSRGQTGKDNMSIKYSKSFITMLQTKSDPRLQIISELPKPDSTPGGSDVPAAQKGLPNGYDNTSDPVYGIASVDDPNLAHYSQPKQVLAQATSPNIFMTYSEVELMLAEAAARGWTTGTPATYFTEGVKAGIWQYTLYSSSIVYDDGAATTYATAQAAALTGSLDAQIKAIAEQYYITTLLNEYEAYANWRRTGYPVLVPVNYKNNETNGQIPRRLRYPRGEYNVNGAHVAAAIADQGADIFMTNIWWDKP
ncbi:SusD/RagB family nutrient-binding outer membrane lipoprotein [Chitinophaga sp. Cy-1792]|uniref:SusD/RagB family nutrient-binding outer membrane lipoprotein n=1 Tax=Chitinophaga sp. Cy-1792 TaxID=2608339 RepID=UPI00141F3A5F|nr:SusD/RagB family nutrient-binding outer membrane lipoprotein [Chitinophaga sp. Cy-1792]NIG57230.1 SusD/RagB family nutrient-binding outer membrane lipoprotein [Chitinophaga sp. Cy-1792]